VPHGIVSAALNSWLNAAASRGGGAPSDGREANQTRGERTMQAMSAGVTRAGTGIDGIVWNILGQTYVPKHVCEQSFSWHATFPPGTFVPPHIHPTQDEFVYLFEGRLDCVIDGREFYATAGDSIRLPMTISHGLFNKSDQAVKCLFWVAPTRRLYDLFWAIHSMKEQKPDEVVALAAKHEIVFLPPAPA
jgi:quercetin dioxygenase-like cupin family protein